MQRKSKLFAGLAVAAGFFLLSFRNRKMLSPVQGKITSPFGDRINPVTEKPEFHNGIDFGVPIGTVVASPANGTVKSIYYNSAGGNQLIIQHTNGYTSGYAHLSSYEVKPGDQVKRGDPVAKSGATGQVTGPHLHFTLRDPSGNYVDPINYI